MADDITDAEFGLADGGVQAAVRTTRLVAQHLPPVLFLSLRRAGYRDDGRGGREFKILDKHVFGRELDVGPYTCSSSGAAAAAAIGLPLPYELVGVVMHRGGTPNSGHYWAYVRSQGAPVASSGVTTTP